MFVWMRNRLLVPFGAGGIAFLPGAWPTVYAREQDRTIRAPAMNRTVKVEEQNRTVSDPRMGGPPP